RDPLDTPGVPADAPPDAKHADEHEPIGARARPGIAQADPIGPGTGPGIAPGASAVPGDEGTDREPDQAVRTEDPDAAEAPEPAVEAPGDDVDLPVEGVQRAEPSAQFARLQPAGGEGRGLLVLGGVAESRHE